MGYLTTGSKPNFLFVHIPKCAGTFIIQAMKREKRFNNGGLFEGQHRPMWSLDKLCKEAGRPIETHFTFSTVRNPWARMVSTYKYALKMKSIFPQFNVTGKNDFNDWVEYIYSDDWDKSIAIEESNLYRDWFNNQSDFFRTEDGTSQYKMDKIIKVEDFHTQIKPFLQGVLGCKNVKPHNKVNETSVTDPRDHYSTFYNQQSIDLVAKHFSKDIEMFNYDYTIK
jgi:hypothetical protein